MGTSVRLAGMAPEQLDNLLERDPLYIKELWGWGAAGAVVMLLRFTVRLRIVGYKGFQGDDFFMIIAFIMGTICLVLVSLSYSNGTSIDLTQDQINVLSDAEIDRLVYGSKLQEAAWQLNIFTNEAKDVVTDAAILSLPLPVLKAIRTSLWRKFLIAALLCSGLVVITVAIMRLTVTLGSAPSNITVNRWGVRECEIGLIATNAPVLRPLFTRKFWNRPSRSPAREPGVLASARRIHTEPRNTRALIDETMFGLCSIPTRIATVMDSRVRETAHQREEEREHFVELAALEDGASDSEDNADL
ncbi:hypothetical protein FOXYS1_2781 [Fusarium oxysporum]|uniref:Rhodopsin domain-containing protein n=1 Tax=Fusarium oxysporum TaxID=5507 RepID=A0A8H5AJ64_FUSOX|nr:hypothetical protein FOXYS1_2781 [Fusarium oxysporum]